MVLALCLSVSAVSHAESAGPSESVAPAEYAYRTDVTESRWYGGPIILTDVGALALTLAWFGTGANENYLPLILAGVVPAYLLGGPIVHLANGRQDTALSSFGLRAGLPIAGALLGYGLDRVAFERRCNAGEQSNEGADCNEFAGLYGGLVGFGLGIVVASVIDISVLAYDHPNKSTKVSWTFTPLIDPKRNATGMSLQGIW